MKTIVKIRLNEILKEKGMSVETAAEKTNLSRPTLYDIKAGRAQAIGLETIGKLCKGLDVEPCDLIEVTKDPNKTARK